MMPDHEKSVGDAEDLESIEVKLDYDEGGKFIGFTRLDTGQKFRFTEDPFIRVDKRI